MLNRLFCLALAGILAVSAWAAGDPDEALRQITELRKTRPTTQQEANSQMAQVRSISEAALKDVDLASVPTAKAISYATLLLNVQRYGDVIPLIDRFVASNPPADQLGTGLRMGIMASAYADNVEKAVAFADKLPSATDQDRLLRAQSYFGFIGEDLVKVKGYEASVELFTSIIAALPAEGPQGDSLRAQGYGVLADVHTAQGQSAKALAALEAGAAAVKDPRFASSLTSRLTQAKLIGNAAPAINPEMMLGSFTSLESLKGKVVVLDFFAHWCGPCKASFPDLRKMYADLKDKGVEIVHATTFYGRYEAETGLTKEQEFEKMKGFVKQHEIVWPVVFLDRAAMQAYGVSGIPHIVLIDADGKVSRHKIGYSPATFAEFRQKVEALAAAAQTRQR